MPRYALDSFALLAFLQGEPSAPQVLEILEAAQTGVHDLAISVVNFGEVLYAFQRRQRTDVYPRVKAVFEDWPIQLIAIDEDLAISAAQLRITRRMGYLDCFVVALALARGGTVVTGDPDFKRVEDLVPIEWLATG